MLLGAVSGAAASWRSASEKRAGDLPSGCTLQIRGKVSSLGAVRTDDGIGFLPAKAAKVEVASPSVVDVEQLPAEGNGFVLKLRNKSAQAVRDISLLWSAQ